jgi:hypothetical protein
MTGPNTHIIVYNLQTYENHVWINCQNRQRDLFFGHATEDGTIVLYAQEIGVSDTWTELRGTRDHCTGEHVIEAIQDAGRVGGARDMTAFMMTRRVIIKPASGSHRVFSSRHFHRDDEICVLNVSVGRSVVITLHDETVRMIDHTHRSKRPVEGDVEHIAKAGDNMFVTYNCVSSDEDQHTLNFTLYEFNWSSVGLRRLSMRSPFKRRQRHRWGL